MLTGLWSLKDIQNSRQNRSKNKLFRENERVEVARYELWAPVQTKKYHSPQPFLDLASNLHTYFQTWKRSQNATYTLHRQKLCHHYLRRLKRLQKDFLKWISNSDNYYPIFRIHSEVKREIRSYTLVVPPKTIPTPRTHTLRIYLSVLQKTFW